MAITKNAIALAETKAASDLKMAKVIAKDRDRQMTYAERMESMRTAREIASIQRDTVRIEQTEMTKRESIIAQKEIKVTEIKETSACIQKKEEETTKRMEIKSKEAVRMEELRTQQMEIKIDGIMNVSKENAEQKEFLRNNIHKLEEEVNNLKQQQRLKYGNTEEFRQLESNIREKQETLNKYIKELDDFRDDEKSLQQQIINL